MRLRFSYSCFVIGLLVLKGIFPSDGYAQRVSDFELVDAGSGQKTSLKDHSSAKAVVLIFTSLNCPFSKLYDERIMALYDTFAKSGVAFLLINPHGGQFPEEQAEKMAEWVKSKSYPMPFLIDEKQEVTKMMNINKIPEVVVVTSGPTGYSVAYRGAIDNNPQSAQGAQMHYLENALTNILSRGSPSPASTRAIGCNVRPF
ncbi:redoxin domain-containing protein [Pleomorphovibrio marinus]|uniref:redoxin domain-containing protein n=1 Tax=Pleomorphovibrio marinus TaxID=2164132 RepID=UPI000E0A2C7B|nr:redoxin domain-containing protein [Pleomorphovibrio marinus]